MVIQGKLTLYMAPKQIQELYHFWLMTFKNELRMYQEEKLWLGDTFSILILMNYHDYGF